MRVTLLMLLPLLISGADRVGYEISLGCEQGLVEFRFDQNPVRNLSEDLARVAGVDSVTVNGRNLVIYLKNKQEKPGKETLEKLQTVVVKKFRDVGINLEYRDRKNNCLIQLPANASRN